jgi:hypothetical protein
VVVEAIQLRVEQTTDIPYDVAGFDRFRLPAAQQRMVMSRLVQVQSQAQNGIGEHFVAMEFPAMGDEQGAGLVRDHEAVVRYEMAEPRAVWRGGLRQTQSCLLRVHPGSYRGLTELSEHQSDGGPTQESKTVSVQAFPVFGQAATPVEPSDGSLDDPALGQHHELTAIGSLDDLDVDLAEDRRQSFLELRPPVATIGVEFQQEGKRAKYRAHQKHAAIAVLDASRMDDGVQQKALRIYQDVALLAFDLLSRIKAGRVNRAPPFSALLTLWLSMIAAVGLASRPASSRHFT